MPLPEDGESGSDYRSGISLSTKQKHKVVTRHGSCWANVALSVALGVERINSLRFQFFEMSLHCLYLFGWVSLPNGHFAHH